MTDPAVTNPQIAIPSRAPSAITADDTVMPFEIAKLDLRGRAAIEADGAELGLAEASEHGHGQDAKVR